MESAVTIERQDRHGVVMVHLNRPAHHNALNRLLVRELTTTFTTLADQKQDLVVILSGKGRSFCAGADLQGIMEASDSGLESALENGRELFDLMTAIKGCPAPVIGKVSGWAVGGGMGLVSCCDLVVASEGAKFGFSEVRLGLVPAVITPFVLSRISQTNARKLYLTGERFGAHRAKDIGLVDYVAGDAAMMDAKVAEWVDMLLQGAPGAQAAVKGLLSEIQLQDKADYRDYTSALFAERVTSVEGREGVEAFLEKRKASWNDAD